VELVEIKSLKVSLTTNFSRYQQWQGTGVKKKKKKKKNKQKKPILLHTSSLEFLTDWRLVG
jgi:hypothetical protein